MDRDEQEPWDNEEQENEETAREELEKRIRHAHRMALDAAAELEDSVLMHETEKREAEKALRDEETGSNRR